MTNPSRFYPRFSIRTLVIFVTLVCSYAACWGPTKERGVGDLQDHTSSRSSLYKTFAVAPLVVAQDKAMFFTPELGRAWGRIDRPRRGVFDGSEMRTYYFWFFGYVAKLPWEREV